MKTLLDHYQPDLIGTQEGLYRQLTDIAADQPAYDWIGLGRDGGSRGEFMAIFYRRDRFEPLEYDHFWLSDTPEVIASSTWGNDVRRMVSWARFRDRTTGRTFYFWNTHLDHEVQPAREKSAALIRQRIGRLPTDVPLFLVGDFNAIAMQNRAYDILTKEAGLTDTWSAARERRNGRARDGSRHVPAGRPVAERPPAGPGVGYAAAGAKPIAWHARRPARRVQGLRPLEAPPMLRASAQHELQE